MDVVFAKYDAVVTIADGAQIRVMFGEHRLASDPAVQARPDVFTTDPRYGMQWYGEPPPEMAPPVEQATAAPGEKRAAVRRG